MSRDNKKVGDGNMALFDANLNVHPYTVSQASVAKAIAAQKLKELKVLAADKEIPGYTPGLRTDYTVSVSALPDFPGLDFGLYVGASIAVWGPYVNTTDSYIEISQLGQVIGEIGPYAMAPKRGIDGVQYVVSAIYLRPQSIPN